MESSGHAIGFWSGWKTLVDGKKQVMPKGGLGMISDIITL